MYEISDESEFRLSVVFWPDGLRGGSAGETFEVDVRVGIGGGRTRPGRGGVPLSSPF
jgi:hypothetical protein